MSTDQLSPRRSARSREDVKLVRYEEYIDEQVESTRRMVKIVDLATSLVVLAAGVLAYLFVVAVVEHWVVPGGFPTAVRAALFLLLAGGVGYFAYRRIWPLIVGRVNPVYAAEVIELSGPSLKNSLINLLLFRQRRREISDTVYRTLEEQAAQRLSHVPLDAAVDRSLLIRLGYVLLAIVAVASLYKVFSPKDPFVAARRVLMPWADIVPASRVQIFEVTPGAATVSRGESLDVSASVRGLDENDEVLVRFSTADGRAVNKPVPMTLSKDGLRFEARLPQSRDAIGNLGLAHDLRYRIEAGDARSLDYEVKVVEAPSMLVDRVEYKYPAYTGYPDREVVGVGDIRAIEGTQITVHARANGSIEEAHVDFDADGRRDLRMAVEEQQARVRFTLRLRDDRQTPEHPSYVLRFTNADGQTSKDPVKYSIQVEPDIGPEVSIRLPQERELTVRLDETVAIEIEAIDPDFALSDVRLHGEVAGSEVVNERLLNGEQQRLNRRINFKPKDYELRAGDTVEYWATAKDNRTPEANTATSDRNVLRILSPEMGQQPPPDRLAQHEPRQGQQQQQQQGQQDQQQGGEQQQNGESQDGAGGQQGQPGAQQPGAAGGEGEPGVNQQPQGGEQNRQPEGGGEGQRRANAEQAGNEQGEQREQAEGGQGEGQAGDEDVPARGAEQGGERGEQNSGGEQTGAGAAGGESSQEGAQPDGARPDTNSGARAGEAGRQNGAERQPGVNSEPSPVSAEGDNDAEAFERIRQHMQREGELSDGEDESQGEAAGGEDAPARSQDEEAQNRAQNQESQQRSEGEGPGAETLGENAQPNENSGNQQQQEKSPGGEQTSIDGPSGIGEEQQPQGAPNSQPDMKPGDQRQQAPSATEESDAAEPPAGGRGKKQSDSQGEQGGDRAGGGEEGGGQQAPRDGTGSAGQNQAADEGAGQSSEQGAGQDSPNAGRDAQAEDPTGESGGETPGRGTKTRPGEQQQPGGGEASEQTGDADGREQEVAREKNDEAGRQRDGKAGEAGGEDASARAEQEVDPNRSEKELPPRDELTNQESAERGNQGGTATGGVGEPGATAGAPPRREGTVPEGDEANLEYARKQTDLVLEKLSDQMNRDGVDDELLDELGWSEDDLRRFVERWQARKEAASRNDRSGDAAERELNEALKSLGLRRGPLKQGPLKEDTMRDLREGYRGAVPQEYRERLRAYNQGVSRARPEGE